MQKTNSARTFDGPRKPRAKKQFGAPTGGPKHHNADNNRGYRSDRSESRDSYTRNDGAGASRGGYQASESAGDRGAKRRGPTSFENAPSFRGGRAAPARAERGGARYDDRPRRDDRASGERGGYRGRDDRGTDRPSYNRGERPAYNRDDRGDRPAYNRDSHGERPAFNRDDRPAYNRGGRDDQRGGRPAYNRDNRGERPSYNRGERPAYNRGNDDQRSERRDSDARPQRDDSRYARRDGGNWGNSGPRRDERPAYNRDRATDRPERGAENRYDRRPTNRDNGGERPSYTRGSDSRPQRDNFRGGSRGDAPRSFRDSDAKPAFVPTEDVKLERLTAVTETAAISGLGFGDLGLDPRIVDKLHAQGITEPFPIQAATIPDAVAGRNVLGRARTGSGKTVAYAAPALTRLLTIEPSKNHGRHARALILAPTRELAMQIDKVVQPLARTVGLFTIAVFGGVPQHKQATGLKRGVDIIIATPGRLEDLAAQGLIDLSAMRIAIIDEADHMCELGFIEPVERILSAVNPNSQKMLYSATLDAEVGALVAKYLPDAVVHEAESMEDDRGSIDHQVLLIENRDKAEIVSELASNNPGRTVVFTRTRAYAEMLAEQLNDVGIGAAALHGDLKQAQRSRNLGRLTRGDVDVLVATDVAARGIHVDDVTLVVQADAPDEYKTYLHRSGRTGRAGNDGVVVTLIPRGRRRRMSEMLDRAEVKAPMREARPGDPLLANFVH